MNYVYSVPQTHVLVNRRRGPLNLLVQTIMFRGITGHELQKSDV